MFYLYLVNRADNNDIRYCGEYSTTMEMDENLEFIDEIYSGMAQANPTSFDSDDYTAFYVSAAGQAFFAEASPFEGFSWVSM